MTAVLDLDTLTPAQRAHRDRRVATLAARFAEEAPGDVPRGVLGSTSRAGFKAMTPADRRAVITEAVDRETVLYLEGLAAERGARRTHAPARAAAPRAEAAPPGRQVPAPSTAAPSAEPRATAAAPTPAPPRTRPGAGLDAVPVGGSVSGGRPADEQPQPRTETEQRKRQRGDRRERFTPGASVVKCVGCASWLPTRPGRSTVARCSPPKRNVKARAACGRWWPGASAGEG